MGKVKQVFVDRADAARLTEGPVNAEAPGWASLVAIALFVGMLAIVSGIGCGRI